MKTEKLIKDWHLANQWVKQCENELKRAKLRYDAAKNALGNFIAPTNANIGEQFNIWVNGECIGAIGDIMLSVKKNSQSQTNNFSIKIRERRKPENA